MTAAAASAARSPLAVRLSRPAREVSLMCVVLAVLSTAVLLPTVSLPVGTVHPHVPLTWWALLPMFVLAHFVTVPVHIGREARLIHVAEVPLVLGLLYASTPNLLVGRTLGALVACALLAGQLRVPAKLAFNTVLAATDAAIAIAVMHALPLARTGDVPEMWWAAVVAAVVANTFAAVAVAVVIHRVDGGVGARDYATVVRSAVPQSIGVAMLGLVVAATLSFCGWGAVPLACVALLLLASYRTHARLNERHLSLEQVYRFTQAVTSASEFDGVLRRTLEEACELLHGRQARVTFVAADDMVEVTLGAGRQLTRGAARFMTADDAWLVDRVIRQERAVLAGRTSRDVQVRHWLTTRGLRESVVVPLRGESGVVAALSVDDRLGEARGFNADDVRLLQAVANHAAVALRNGELMRQLRHDSLHDALTGLPNRVSFQQHLDTELNALTDGAAVAVAIVDLNAFKDVNDTLGHQAGDQLLREVAARLADASDDRVFVARLGGDEFAVVIGDCPDTAAARHVGGELLASLHEPVQIDDVTVSVGASMGVALAPVHGAQASVLLKHADIAMYAAKEGGVGVVVFDPSLDTTSRSRLGLVSRLRAAISDDEISIHVQPQVDLVTGQVRCGEALARWTLPDGQQVPPNEFVALAERSGLIRPLTNKVLTRAIAACAEWQSVAPGVGVAVNLSMRALVDRSLLHNIDFLLRRYSVPAHLLTLEITESSIIEEPGHTLDVLAALRRAGVTLSIDDFGTGYSSLSYLRRLPVSEVKIDRSFVRRMTLAADDAAVVRTIVQLGQNLNLRVVAEGVEDEATWRALLDAGCDIVQGYFVSRPLPVEDFRRWLAARPADARLTTGKERPARDALR